ncbi:hypothetical protein WJX81_007657 [Elliptochloris bilobata]|uniref:ShKT domain-containing protein n=1 Tax=Elliptochloris bilobata TaxID=381761 RepID=A0AAW1S1I0_9CHLO
MRFPVENFVDHPGRPKGYELHSTTGTYTRLDLERLQEAGGVRRDAERTNAAAQEEAASAELAGLVRCEVCYALARGVWEPARQAVHATAAIPPDDRLLRLLRHSCQSQTPREVLRKWAMARTAVPVTQAAAKGMPSAFELEIVRRSCQALLQEAAPWSTAAQPALAVALREQLEEYRAAWEALGGRAPPALAHASATPDGRTCRDYHPECAHWAAQGECEANPRYMVGDEGQKEHWGFCRLACATCSPEAPAGVHASSEAMLEQAAERLRDALTDHGCRGTPACEGLPGATKEAMDGAGSDSYEVAARVAAQVLAATGGELAALPETEQLDRNAWLLHRAASLPAPAAATGPPPHAAVAGQGAAARMAQAALAQHCFYAQPEGGWWRVEVCPGARVRQYHASDAGVVEAIIELGAFDAQATRELRPQLGMRPADLHPGAPPRAAPRFLRQVFTSGDACNSHDGPSLLDSLAEQAPRRRSAELLLGCSPLEDDGEAYLVVREPEPCRYVLALGQHTELN